MKWTNSWAATNFVSLWLALDPWFVFYATEARPYVFLQLLSVIQIELFASWLSHRSNSPSEERQTSPTASSFSRSGLSFLLVFTSVLIFYFHYTGAFLLLAEIVFLIVGWYWLGTASGFRRPSVWELACLSSAFLLLALPGLLHLFSVFGQRHLWSSVSSGSSLLQTFILPLATTTIAPLAIAVVMNGLNAKDGDQKTQRSNPRMAVLVAFWILVPIAAAYFLDMLKIAPIALPRYCIVATTGITIFAGLMIGSIQQKIGRIFLSLAVLCLVLCFNPLIRQFSLQEGMPRLRSEDWSIVEQIKIKAPDCRTVFLFGNVLEDQLAFTNTQPEFHRYLQFPVRGYFKSAFDGIEVYSGNTTGRVHFSDEQIQKIDSNKSETIVLIVRGRNDLLLEIVADLEARSRTRFETKIFGSPNLDVHLVFLNVRD